MGQADPLRIAHFGTFEVDNYGDLLFPLILRRELEARLGPVDLTLCSPLAGTFPADRQTPVHAIPELDFAGAARRFDAFVVGGGDLVSFHGKIAPVYDREWHEDFGAHSACWALPLIHRPPSVPVIWNAPGVPHRLSPGQARILRDLCAEVERITVRDQASRQRLLEAGVGGEVHVVPDTAFLLPRLIARERLVAQAAQLLEPLGVEAGRFLLFQASPAALRSLGKRHASVARFLEKLGRELGLRVLLLPIGGCHGDEAALSRLEAASEGRLGRVAAGLEPEAITALIAASAAFVGSSLHGNVAAFAFGVPHLVLNASRLAKLDGFAVMTAQPERCVHRWSQLVKAAPRILRYDRVASQDRRELLAGRVAAHFDVLAEIVRARSEARRSEKPAVPDLRLQEERLRLLRAERVGGSVPPPLASVLPPRGGTASRRRPGDPEISAIVTSCNHEAYVAQAVRSALDQRGVEGEVIVVDDASTDGTHAILEDFAGAPGLRISVAQRNRGISRTFNRGLELARGEFVAFLGSDDWWLPGHLSGALERLRRDDAAMLYARVRTVDERDRETDAASALFASVPQDAFFGALLRGPNFVPFISVVVRREVALAAGGFDEGLVTLQDHDLWIRIAARHAVHFRDEVVGAFRWAGRNASAPNPENSARFRSETVQILERALRDLPAVRREGHEAAVRRRLAASYRRLARRVSDSRERARCRRHSLSHDLYQPSLAFRYLAARLGAGWS